MHIFSSDFRNKYVQHFPSDVPLKMAQGFFASAAIVMICGAGMQSALIAGSVSMTATLVEAVARPIIRMIFPNHPKAAQMFQIGLATGIAALTIGALTQFRLGEFRSKHDQVKSGLLAYIMSLIAYIGLNDSNWNRNNQAVALP